jgi:WD40 repeat protein
MINIWNIQTGKLEKTLPIKPGVEIISLNGANVLLETQSVEVLTDIFLAFSEMPIQGHLYHNCSHAFSEDCKVLAVGTSDASVEIWNVATGMLKTTCKAMVNGWVLGVAVDPSSQYVAGCGNDIHIWDIETGILKVLLRGHSAQVNSIVFSQDGHRLFSSSSDHTIRIWDWELGNHEAGLETDMWIKTIALSSDGNLAATGAWYGIVSTWDMSTGNRLSKQLTLSENLVSYYTYRPIMSVAFSPDMQSLVSVD